MKSALICLISGCLVEIHINLIVQSKDKIVIDSAYLKQS